jgi:hypothetical protein
MTPAGRKRLKLAGRWSLVVAMLSSGCVRLMDEGTLICKSYEDCPQDRGIVFCHENACTPACYHDLDCPAGELCSGSQGVCQTVECTSRDQSACGAYSCLYSTCNTSCSDAKGCASGFRCDRTRQTCEPPSPNGFPCAEGDDCQSGRCCDASNLCGTVDADCVKACTQDSECNGGWCCPDAASGGSRCRGRACGM